jgi:hypothetical protein
MKLRAIVVVLFAFACSAGACSLNPQPLPPGSYDGSTAGLDAGKGGSDATAFGDAGAPPPEDAGVDAPVLDGDAGDAGDAESDATTDAGDAEVDASDAEADAATD